MVFTLPARPPPSRHRSYSDLDRARQLVRRYGTDTLACFALRDDKQFLFSPDGEAMIACTRLGNHVLVSGDPIGHPDSIDAVLDELFALCSHRSWHVAFLGVREDHALQYRARGLQTFYLGDEAVVDCERFSLAGKRNKSMRQSVGRVARTHRFEMLPETDASPALIRQLNALSERWRGRAPERGFTMTLGRSVDGRDPDSWLCVALDEDGTPGGFLRLLPLYGGASGMTLDLMRRDPDAPNGTTEFLIARSVERLQDLGLRWLSVNFAVMGRLFAPNGPLSASERLMRSVVSLGNPFFQIRSLHEFSRRLRPLWVPRVIAYERSLPWVALLYSGLEGHLSWPLIGRRFAPPGQTLMSSHDWPGLTR